MLKRFLCIMLCVMMIIPAALADTADTLPKRFIRQLSSGNGARGYISVTASGVADWLNLLMPFTATDIQMRAIGQKQGDLSENIDDDDEWQIKFFAKDAAGNEAGTSWLYGDPEGIYFKSEMLPEKVLKVQVDQVHLLYQIFKGEFNEMFFAFDPLEMKTAGENGNTPAYQAVANVLGIDDAQWEEEWLPVLDKYLQSLDLWLAGYGESSILNEDSGRLTMSATYTIPVDEFKEEAKYIIGQMMYDNELQELLIPHVTMEQRITYLNPQMVYFYNACIDALRLEGDIVLSREMSAMGEVVSTKIVLPLPKLPEKLTAPVNALAQKMLGLPYEDLLADADMLTLCHNGNERQMVIAGDKRTITFDAVETTTENGIELNGELSILPAENSKEQAVNAAFSIGRSHRIWQDEKYIDHDTTDMKFSLEPVSEDDAGFKPVAFSVTLDYRNNPSQQNSPVQVNLNVDAELPDAQFAVEAVLRITTQITMEKLSSAGAEDVSKMTEEEKNQLLLSFVQNALVTMSSLNETQQEMAPASPTQVPPVSE